MKKLLTLFLAVACWIVVVPVVLHAEVSEDSTGQPISEVVIEGNRLVDAEVLMKSIEAKPGMVTSEVIDKDLKKLFLTGSFDQIKAVLIDHPSEEKDKILKYVVTEKPVVRKVLVKGNEEVSEEDLSEVLSFGEKRLIDREVVENIAKAAVTFYQEKGFYDASVDYTIEPVGDQQVDVVFAVTEGEKFKIRRILITGTDKIDPDDLLDVIQTRRYKWWNSWLMGTGRVNPEMLKNDKALMQQYLLDNGYIESGVSDPVVERVEGGLEVIFEVQEGAQFKIGKVSVFGDLIDESAEKTLEGIVLEEGEVFSGTSLREDSFRISEKFEDIGYAFANVVPNTSIRREENKVDINFSVSKGDPVTVNRINVTGNDKTFDNVIRRELTIQEQELYSGSRIRRSKVLLERLGYFEEVNITSEPDREKDQVNLKVDVHEGSTGSFSAGAGYSTSDGAIFNINLTEANIFGTGRRLSLNLSTGTERENYVLSLQDRRFNDSYWSLGMDVRRTERKYYDFDRSMGGGGVSVGYPLDQFFGEWAEDIAFSLRYEYLDITIDNVNPEDAAPLVIASEGTSTSSGLTPRLIRNTINNPLNPTHGSRQILSYEMTGLGGSEEYYLLQLRNTLYYPIFEINSGDVVFSWRFNFAFGETFDGDPFPLHKRFFPGGINSVRGYKARTMGPTDEDGNEYGGSKLLVNNLEILVPLVSSAGLKGVLFFDIGEAFDDDENITFSELRRGYGFGIRWMSPMGPIRIELGYPLDQEEGDSSSQTMFTFGAPL